MRSFPILVALLIVLPAGSAPAAAAAAPVDVVVYGATPSGVMAAVQARRHGRTVALVEPSAHVGGMVTGGLSRSDLGRDPAVIGGITREYFGRIANLYGSGTGYNFEPKIGAQVMSDMIRASGAALFTGQRALVRVSRAGTALTSFTTAAGTTFAGKEFVDASYEGDLMAAAGVSSTIGRESSAQYNEAAAGVRPSYPGFHPTVPARDANGLLYPQISPEVLGPVGSADRHVQPYTYRVTATTIAANRVPFPKPAGYDPNDFALLARWLPLDEARLGRGLTAADLLTMQPLPNGKIDVNSSGPFSTDFVNGSFDYPNGTAAERQDIAQRTKDYEQGFLYFLQNDPSVPASLHADMARYGLAADEFVDNGNWPTQLYIREARRMMGALVLTQQHLETGAAMPDTVAMGSYRMDGHTSFRGVDAAGNVFEEGALSAALVTARDYFLPYRIMTPPSSEATNLLVTGALSASHVAWSGIRMEPQLMMLGHAAADAASLAISAGVPVQSVSIPALQELLLREGMILSVGQKTTVIVDNTDPGTFATTGPWSTASSTAGFYGTDYRYNGGTAGTQTAQWTPNLPSAGSYAVSARWTANSNRTTSALYTVTDSAGKRTQVTLNQRLNGGAWVPLGTFSLKAGNSAKVTLSTAGATGYLIADAVRFTK